MLINHALHDYILGRGTLFYTEIKDLDGQQTEKINIVYHKYQTQILHIMDMMYHRYRTNISSYIYIDLYNGC